MASPLKLFITLFLIHATHLFAIESHLDEKTLKTLADCAKHNTLSLKKKISEKSIQQFKNYCLETLSEAPAFPVALFYFTPSDAPSIKGTWSKEIINYNKIQDVETTTQRTLQLFHWLEKNYTPSTAFKFFYLPAEPYYFGWDMKTKYQTKLSALLDSCPLLLSCTHPDLAWSKKGILIPDSFILDPSFENNINKLINGPTQSTEKSLIPFSKRRSSVYFRGGLTGPKMLFSMQNMQENPRQHLLFLLNNFPYVDMGITSFSNLIAEKKDREFLYYENKDYLIFLIQKFGYLACYPVDFFEHAKNKYLLSCDGLGAAWSRVELIMATGSVLFLNAQCEQYFYHLMENNKTHININKDFSNLDAEFQRLENMPKLAEEIGKQGQQFAKSFFTKDAIDAYLWLALNELETSCQAPPQQQTIDPKAHVQLLIKMPTRNRPEKFFSVLDTYYKFLSHNISYLFLISCDEDDTSMNNEEVRNKLAQYPNLVVYFGKNKSKIAAYNADMDKHPNFDVVMAASDDMIPEVQNYDEIIVKALYEKFPDLDGAVHFNDGAWGNIMCTLSIMGNKLYRRFGYIYYPEYKSICCDYEFTTICSNFNKLAYFDTVLIRHVHPLINKNVEQDALFVANTKYDKEDITLFENRKKISLGCRNTWLTDTDPDKKS